MAKKARSEEQILRALHQAESGERGVDICREHMVAKPCSMFGRRSRAVWR
jgi:hypothetical protein